LKNLCLITRSVPRTPFAADSAHGEEPSFETTLDKDN